MTRSSSDSTRAEPERLESESTSIFLPERRGARDGFVATGLARGPWHADTQHGGPMLALLARAVELVPSDAPMQVTRLTVDLMRAAPLSWVETHCRKVRSGRNVEVIEASLRSGDEEYARASAMRFRLGEVEVEEDSVIPAPPGLPEERPQNALLEGTGEAFHLAQEMRPTLVQDVPALWLRLVVPLVAGEPTSPLQRVAAAADHAYSVPFVARVMRDPASLRERPVVAINPDTTVNLHRPLEGEWVCLQGASHQDPSGAGTAFAQLFDARGPIGLASQSILLRGAEFRPASWSEYDDLLERARERNSRK